ncbi:MAG: hypothetical protein AB7W37_10280 [Syntrophobacteraceae bacterium]
MLAAVTLALHCASIHNGAAERRHGCTGMRLQDERSGVDAAVPPSYGVSCGPLVIEWKCDALK